MRYVRRAARSAVGAFRRVWWRCVHEYYPIILKNPERDDA